VLDGGHIVEGGKPAELSEAPKQEVTRRLVSARYPPPVRHPPRETVETPTEATAPDEQSVAAARVVAAVAATVAMPTVEVPEVAEPDAKDETAELLHGLSAQIVIAPVVLADPVPMAMPPEGVAASAAGDPPPAPGELGAVSELLLEAGLEEAAASSDDRADEAGEGGESEIAVAGLIDAAGGADTPDGEAGR
jgi:hypothetical protein